MFLYRGVFCGMVLWSGGGVVVRSKLKLGMTGGKDLLFTLELLSSLGRSYLFEDKRA